VIKLIYFVICLTSLAAHAGVKSVYQSTEVFVNNALDDNQVEVKVLWISVEDKKVIAEIMQHKFNRLRVRYWQKQNETVWILDEIGKEKPITIGVHIKAQAIVNLKVLTFRESRGDEVKHDFFTDQFTAAQLTADNRLSQHIDGITGATLSVRALTKVARLALWLNKKAQIL